MKTEEPIRVIAEKLVLFSSVKRSEIISKKQQTEAQDVSGTVDKWRNSKPSTKTMTIKEEKKADKASQANYVKSTEDILAVDERSWSINRNMRRNNLQGFFF